MSRIELAMEKAALLRQGLQEPVVPDHPEPATQEARPPSPAPAPAPAPVRRLATEQRLNPRNPLLVSLHDPRSPAAEEYRKLKSVLVQGAGEGTFRNSIAITSSLPNEGKSLTALNLAISLSQQLDHTVLLVDGDLRRPSLHSYLEIDRGIGLADVLVGAAAVADAILPTGIGKLSVMRAGRHVDNPAELFSSQRMKDLVHELKHRYPDRYLIFDTPPVLPFAETRELSALVDGVLFVVMERLAPRESVRDALESLKGSEVLGVVFIPPPLGANDERYSYYHSYGS